VAGFELPFDIHGEPLFLKTGAKAIADAARDALGGFAVERLPAGAPLEIDLQAADGSEDLQPPRSTAVLVREVPQVAGSVPLSLYRDGCRWRFDFGGAGRLLLDPVLGRVTGCLAAPGCPAPDWAAGFVLLSAIELLRTRGRYAVHGAGLEREGRGVLVVGASGAGKTTACLSLLRAGYRCLSDDHPLLCTDGDGFQLLPFPGRIAVTQRTVSWFPELRAVEPEFRSDTRKRSFPLDRVADYSWGERCRPALLIFPRIVDWPESSVARLSGARALEELLPQTLLVLDPQLAGAQFQVMSELVRTTPAYRLHFGEDVTRLPEIVDRLLESLEV